MLLDHFHRTFAKYGSRIGTVVAAGNRRAIFAASACRTCCVTAEIVCATTSVLEVILAAAVEANKAVKAWRKQDGARDGEGMFFVPGSARKMYIALPRKVGVISHL
jgi:hypothetical protein